MSSSFSGEAISIETAISILHPDWPQERIAREAQCIRKEIAEKI